MFPFYREDLIRSQAEERERRERRNHLLRELRGATPPFDGGVTRRLAAALAESYRSGRAAYRGERRPAVPCPDATEPMRS
jgi:hypothetical protein